MINKTFIRAPSAKLNKLLPKNENKKSKTRSQTEALD